ncbi:hypothetical protein CRI77_16795 [Mycolicibacterium duvalii]|uniref:Uncharacterized protein n=1 Tax=Mycolicibacterium duvalii TaxID=39688 RepID=A0A7I7K4T7_9MYCO|nr:hypothetical protein [Mycolicibacterium duvalii]MCV7368025.1 hypothetical protein [Mycolicibacterium duvalii]PEG38985.1 hypothetical protein CRI77_16795 [Mycolicibacterium duvalii]BBX18382.1 hypothetical protein MDUV_32420 [Mycolicibacterium duvalii]
MVLGSRREGLLATAVISLCLFGQMNAPVAHGVDPELALNGTYAAVSIGEWAKTNEVYIDQRTVRSTWTIVSSCSDPGTCFGHVHSDHGWSAEITLQSNMWSVRREIPDWMPCPGGGAYPGRQLFRFTPAGPAGRRVVGSPVLSGEDVTAGPAGACGVGQPLVIRMPFRLEKVG